MQTGETEHGDLENAEVSGLQQQDAESEEAERVGDEVAALVDVAGNWGERNFYDPGGAGREDGGLAFEEAWQHQRAGYDIDDEEHDKCCHPLLGKNRAQISQSRFSSQRSGNQQPGERGK